ncbi:MAG: hypothetical protein HYR90_02300 [Candidatus Andersenbacteria bacterium]|nr:hypothetical protein [Candidatus Andersenbacteria bacterium]MBI3250990.1 hypothetical protein [Candidatus Andersenbacteria bacterium]
MEDKKDIDKQVPEQDDSISMLRKQLYAKDESRELQTRAKELATPRQLAEVPLEQNEGSGLVDIIAKQKRRRQKLLYIVSIAGVVIAVTAASAAATLWYRRAHRVLPENIVLTIQAPADVMASDTIEVILKYKNDSRVRWDNVELRLDTPAGFRVGAQDERLKQTARNQYTASLGTVEPAAEGQLTFSGQLIGEQGSTALVRTQIFFTPENFPSGRFDASQSHSITIASVPLEISVAAPGSAASGERIPVTIRVRNIGDEPIIGGKLKMEPAPGVQLAPEDTEFSPDFSISDSSWQLPTLQSLEEVTRIAVWYVDGQAGERRIVTIKGLANAGEEEFLLRTVDQSIAISASEVAISQTFTGRESDQPLIAGETIEGKIEYQNTGTTALSNAVVSLQFEGNVIDPSKIQIDTGAYDPIARTINWKAASVPELATLAPQEKGELKYKFALLPLASLPADESVKNQNLIITASITSPDLPVRSGQEERSVTDRLVLPVATSLLLSVDSFYDDGRLGLKSSGPLPPKVGSTTSYTVRFRLGTSLNDVGDVKLRGVLPESVHYTGNVYKTEGEVTFNDHTNEVLWDIPFIAGLAGRSGPAPELHVQVSVTPGENVRGQEVVLLSAAAAQATDLFADIAVSAEVKVNDLPDTEKAVPTKGEVE